MRSPCPLSARHPWSCCRLQNRWRPPITSPAAGSIWHQRGWEWAISMVRTKVGGTKKSAKSPPSSGGAGQARWWQWQQETRAKAHGPTAPNQTTTRWVGIWKSESGSSTGHHCPSWARSRPPSSTGKRSPWPIRSRRPRRPSWRHGRLSAEKASRRQNVPFLLLVFIISRFSCLWAPILSPKSWSLLYFLKLTRQLNKMSRPVPILNTGTMTPV